MWHYVFECLPHPANDHETLLDPILETVASDFDLSALIPVGTVLPADDLYPAREVVKITVTAPYLDNFSF